MTQQRFFHGSCINLRWASSIASAMLEHQLLSNQELHAELGLDMEELEQRWPGSKELGVQDKLRDWSNN